MIPATAARRSGIDLVATAALALVAVMYAGLTEGYIPSIRLNFGPVEVLLALAALGSLTIPGAGRRLAAVLPAILWLTAYYTWALIVASNPGELMPRAMTRLAVFAIVMLAVGLTLRDRKQLRYFAGLAQIVMVVNVVVCLLQSSDPEWITRTLRSTSSPTQDDILGFLVRPVGLWGNQNDAGRLFIFGILLSVWAPTPLAWIGRAAGVVGILLTASRFSVYVLALLTLYVLLAPRRSGVTSAGVFRTVMTAATVAAAIVASVWLANSTPNDPDQISALQHRLERIQDATEENSQHQTRLELAGVAYQDLADAPFTGNGLYTFQQAKIGVTEGAHNMYLAIWGEAGLFMFVGYLALLVICTTRAARARLPQAEKTALMMGWGYWMVAGFASHALFESHMYYVVLAVLLAIPLVEQPVAQPAMRQAFRPEGIVPETPRPVPTIA